MHVSTEDETCISHSMSIFAHSYIVPQSLPRQQVGSWISTHEYRPLPHMTTTQTALGLNVCWKPVLRQQPAKEKAESF